MTLFEKIISIYPELTDNDFSLRGTITLQNNSDGQGDYIKEWNHPTLTQPTQEDLDGIDA
jgi:hypothetical protein